tara:strand:- start:118 stop:450 length:333 start_codon:yes stop_codon:yes gene_type:complete
MLDRIAILKAYPDINLVSDTKAFRHDKNGQEIDVTSELDQSLIDAARAEINALNYQKSRTGEDGTTDTIYPDLGEQFDLLFKDLQNGTLTTSGNFFTTIKAVKDKYPKPS